MEDRSRLLCIVQWPSARKESASAWGSRGLLCALCPQRTFLAGMLHRFARDDLKSDGDAVEAAIRMHIHTAACLELESSSASIS